MAKYKVRWKGKELGEFSRLEIEDCVRSSKMGFLHQVFVGEDWVGLKYFLNDYEEEIPPQKLDDKIVSLAYFSTGLAFLYPYLIIISLCFAGYLYKKDAKKNASWVASLAFCTMLLGFIFFKIIRYINP